MRAALQIAIENTQSAVTFLGYACSGAGIEAGILGPQEYVESVSAAKADSSEGATPPPSSFLSGDSKDAQIRWLLRELCAVKSRLTQPEKADRQPEKSARPRPRAV